MNSPSSPASSVFTVERTASLGPARFMFAFDALSAGAIGIGLLAAPERVGELLFATAQDPVAARLIGAMFTGIAIVSVAGIREAARYLPLFLVQGVYKALWVTAILPAAGERPAVAGMAASFGVYLAGYVVALRAAGWPSFARLGRR